MPVHKNEQGPVLLGLPGLGCWRWLWSRTIKVLRGY